MKLAFYINSIHEGGAERVITNLATYFSNTDYEVILITSFYDKWEYPYDDKIKRIVLEDKDKKNNRIIKNVSRVIKLRRVIKKEKPDCLISFMAEPNYRALLACSGLKTKSIISVRNEPKIEYSGKAGWLLGHFLLPIADGCVFQTTDAQEWFPKRLKKKSTIIYNAVKDDFYHADRKPVRNLIVSCGRLEEQKNYPLLIKAFTKVVDEIPDARLFIYGDGSLKNKIADLIKKNNLENKVYLKGQTKNVVKALKEADLFVLSSLYEGMPNALMEAMAVGVPCISTDCPCGGPKMLFDSVGGILVTNNDQLELEKAIRSVLFDDEKKNSLGNQAKIKAEVFSSDKIYRRWELFINSVCYHN